MTKFAYNNAKNPSFGYMHFELNFKHNFQMFYKEDIKLCSQSKFINKLLVKLRKLMIVYRNNVYHAQNFQKQAYNKGIKPKNYASGNNVWLNRKYIKTEPK